MALKIAEHSVPFVHHGCMPLLCRAVPVRARPQGQNIRVQTISCMQSRAAMQRAEVQHSAHHIAAASSSVRRAHRSSRQCQRLLLPHQAAATPDHAIPSATWLWKHPPRARNVLDAWPGAALGEGCPVHICFLCDEVHHNSTPPRRSFPAPAMMIHSLLRGPSSWGLNTRRLSFATACKGQV